MIQKFHLGLILVLSLSIVGKGFAGTGDGGPERFAQNAELQFQRRQTTACALLLKNIEPSGAALGAVVASPSRENPNYFYHWIRDAALVMITVAKLYRHEPAGAAKENYARILTNYIEFSRKNQGTATLTGLGEPKFNVDGSAFNENWGRPQNDGPALRAIAFMEIYVVFTETERAPPPVFFNALMDDLNYVSHRWRDPSYDLWEEVRGDHFYSRMVERRALLNGAWILRKDPVISQRFWREARLLESEILKHWTPAHADSPGILAATLRRDPKDHPEKTSDLDTAVLLGVLHGNRGDGFLITWDDRVIATVHELLATFKNLYPVNSDNRAGIALGRYPQDLYFNGNPWVLTTYAAAEFHFKLAVEMARKGTIQINELTAPFFRSLVDDPVLERSLTLGRWIPLFDPLFETLMRACLRRGEGFLARVELHGLPEGSLSEQMDRHTGFMLSAADLTWNYASALTAHWAREALIQHLENRR